MENKTDLDNAQRISERKDDMKLKEKFTFLKTRKFILFVILALVLLSCIIGGIYIINSNLNYDKGLEAISSGNYKEAIGYFEKSNKKEAEQMIESVQIYQTGESPTETTIIASENDPSREITIEDVLGIWKNGTTYIGFSELGIFSTSSIEIKEVSDFNDDHFLYDSENYSLLFNEQTAAMECSIYEGCIASFLKDDTGAIQLNVRNSTDMIPNLVGTYQKTSSDYFSSTDTPKQDEATRKAEEETVQIYEPQKIVDSNGKQIWKIYISDGDLHFTGTYNGSGNFIVKLSDSNQDLIEVIANEIGDYVSDKTVYVPYEGWYYLEVYGSHGNWTFNWN